MVDVCEAVLVQSQPRAGSFEQLGGERWVQVRRDHGDVERDRRGGEAIEQFEQPRVAPARVVVAEAEHRRRPGGVERVLYGTQPVRHVRMTPASPRDDASNR